jgi:hypothetical protein
MSASGTSGPFKRARPTARNLELTQVRACVYRPAQAYPLFCWTSVLPLAPPVDSTQTPRLSGERAEANREGGGVPGYTRELALKKGARRPGAGDGLA